MSKSPLSKIKKLQVNIREFLEEKGIVREDGAEPSKLLKFCHFWLFVGRSFARNKCPIRASALAYATLLALIPMLAVALSVSTSILKKDGGARIQGLVNTLVDSVVPPASLTNVSSTFPISSSSSTDQSTNTVASGKSAEAIPMDARKQVAQYINEYVQKTQSETLGVVSTVLLLFVAITMLSRIEEAFNDIWGVSQGRSWAARIVQYWAVITLGPILLAAALGLAGGPHLAWTTKFFSPDSYLGSLFFKLLPVVVLSLSFAVFYMFMPNTKVHWQAALVGGTVGGVLWHANNLMSVLYVSRVVTNSKIYGSLAMVPVFMVGLYFSWLIMLFGAQVAYAYQNRSLHLQDRLAETISQRGREFLSLRLMQVLGEAFQKCQPPPSVPEMAALLGVPTKVVQRIMETLVSSHLAIEVVVGKEIGYAPARPLEAITCHDILVALRVGRGQELVTRDGPARTEVFGEYEKIMEAERKIATAVTLLELTTRTEALKVAGQDLKAVGNSTT